MDKLKVYPIMIPTTDISSPLFKGRKTGTVGLTGGSLSGDQHLYLVSDREIKEGDCYYNSINGRIYKDAGAGVYDKIFKKVEATTNLLLGLPIIPKSFIEEYVQKQGKIETVYIQQYLWEDKSRYTPDIRYGEVIILPVKDSWNREEHKKGALDAINWYIGLRWPGKNLALTYLNILDFNEWFDKNY